MSALFEIEFFVGVCLSLCLSRVLCVTPSFPLNLRLLSLCFLSSLLLPHDILYKEEPSTPILKTPAVEGQHKPEGMVGGGERPIIEEDGNVETSISCGATTSKEEKADTEVGTTTSERHDTGHALRPAEGQGTSMHRTSRNE